MNDELIEAAIDCIGLGLPVIALTGKAPNGRIHRHGLNEAMTDLDLHDSASAIHAAFTHKDTTGIGLVIPYPYVVVDIDSEEGAENWKNLVGDDQFMPDRWVAKTAHGLHLWYASIEPVGNFKPFGNTGGVDIKGQGGYVAAPPSWHPGYPDEGIAPGRLYTWLLEPDDDPPREAPDALLARIRKHNFDREGAIIRKGKTRRVRHQPFEGGRLWASFGFDHLYEAMKNEPAGNRNNYLHWAAATMAEEGATDEEFNLLLAEAKDLGHAGKRTVRSARRGRG